MLEIDETPEVEDYSFEEHLESVYEDEFSEVPSEQNIIQRIN